MTGSANDIVEAIGGVDNIVEVEPCITRLRCEVHDEGLVDQDALKAMGAHGVVVSGSAVQIVVGTLADNLASEIEDLLEEAQ